MHLKRTYRLTPVKNPWKLGFLLLQWVLFHSKCTQDWDVSQKNQRSLPCIEPESRHSIWLLSWLPMPRTYCLPTARQWSFPKANTPPTLCPKAQKCPWRQVACSLLQQLQSLPPTCSNVGGHGVCLRCLTWEMWRPRLRWTLQHSSQIKTPLFMEAQHGSEREYWE